MAWVGVCLIVALSVALTAVDASTQTYQGGMRGAVRDANGVVPGADVTLVNEETAVERTTVTNAVGGYAFPNVLPGVYSWCAPPLQGLGHYESRGIQLVRRSSLQLARICLSRSARFAKRSRRPGSSPVVIETTIASVGTLIERQALETLPNVGRNPFVIWVIAPHVIPTGVPQFVRMQDQNATAMLSLVEARDAANNFLLDGVSITDLFNRAAIIPSIEAIEEVRVQVSTYDAELGRTGGGVFNTTHKSGSNAWHGSALFLDRPDGEPANCSSLGRPASRTPRNGLSFAGAASFGGPLVRNRTFFWASHEGYKTQTTANQVITLPTAFERRGNIRSPSTSRGSRSSSTIH